LADGNGRIETIEIGGLLVLETAQQFKNELVSILDRLSDKVNVIITDLEEMDLSCLQLLTAFTRSMDKKKINYIFTWDIDEEQRSLFVNVGVGVELFMKN